MYIYIHFYFYAITYIQYYNINSRTFYAHKKDVKLKI